MQHKASRPLFRQAISAVKKQVVDQKQEILNKKDEQQGNGLNKDYEDMSSGQQQRLVQLGVDINKTKKITKQQKPVQLNKQSKQWKHDKYKINKQSNNNHKQNKQSNQQQQQQQNKIKSQSNSIINNRLLTISTSTPTSTNTKQLIIRFPQRQQYGLIYGLIKSQKAFIQQIDQYHIKFSKLFAFSTCKSILKSNHINFIDQTIKKQQTINLNKENIFDRLK